MNRKEIAVKNVTAGLCALFVTAFLLSCPCTLMRVQAACEEPVQQESDVEIQPENGQDTAPQTPEGTADAAQMPAEATVDDAVQTPAEGAAEDAQSPAESAAEEIPAQPENVEEAAPQPLSVTMVGDSVMLGGSPSILLRLPDCVIDAKVSRQFTAADSVLDSLEQQGLLRQTVVIGLGTNGAFSMAKGQELINRLGSERTIYWVTVYGRALSWQEEVNATIRQLAEANENVHIIDWTQAASQHAEWICSDGIHLSAAGREGYAQTVLEGLQ